MTRRITPLRMAKAHSAREFVNEMLIRDTSVATPCLEIYKAYDAWCVRQQRVRAPDGLLMDFLGELGPGATYTYRIREGS